MQRQLFVNRRAKQCTLRTRRKPPQQPATPHTSHSHACCRGVNAAHDVRAAAAAKRHEMVAFRTLRRVVDVLGAHAPVLVNHSVAKLMAGGCSGAEVETLKELLAPKFEKDGKGAVAAPTLEIKGLGATVAPKFEKDSKGAVVAPTLDASVAKLMARG